ncbi:MAG: M23 family metallopeptidase [Gammaproteobacteria bacterium]|nr:M23 family metallopeptidase [Gammaproteobacteria bacterium]
MAEIHLFEENERRGRVYFYNDQAAVPAQAGYYRGEITLHCHVSQLHPMIDTLRNETPIYLRYESARDAYLTTGREPVGEGESTDEGIITVAPYVDVKHIASVTGVYCQSGNCPWEPPTRLHDGIDFAPAEDFIPFQAVCTGVVRRIDKFLNEGNGNWQVNVDIEHDATYGVGYAFEPMSPDSAVGDEQEANITVQVGTEVSPGAVIGHLVKASDAAHVHFGFFRHFAQVCPEPYLASGVKTALFNLIRRDHPEWNICH